MHTDAQTRIDLDTAAPDPPALPSPLTAPWVVLVVHRIGTEGPWWADCREIEADGTLGWIVHSGAFRETREEAVKAAREGLKARYSPTKRRNDHVRDQSLVCGIE